MTYVADVEALARKDLLLELRAKETLPAMLLFVIAALTIFHFALPHGTSHAAALGLLWAALIFTALLGLTRAFVPEREQGMFDALVLAPCDRSAIWLGKALAVLAFLVAAEVVALPAFAAFFSGIDGRTVAAVALADIGIAAVGTLLSWAAFEYVVSET
jgi:heme exporter protein B